MIGGYQSDTYDWKVDNFVRKEIVIQPRQVRAAASDELNCGVHIDAQAIGALNGAYNTFALLDQQFLLRGEVLDD